MAERAEERSLMKKVTASDLDAPYQVVFGDVSKIVDAARDSATPSVNAAMTAAYWLIGHRIVEFEQSGEERATYGTALMERLATDLTQRFGRGFSRQNIQYMRLFYVSYPFDRIRQALSGKSDSTFLELRLGELLAAFPLPWSTYVRLLSVKNTSAREFYGAEAFRGGWSVRQLDRQVNSQFYERTALSKNRAAMLTKGPMLRHEDRVEIKDPFVLEFLDLKDEYSESDLEEALIRHLETFLLELGVTSASWAAKGVCASVTGGSGWTCCSSTGVCDVSWSSTSRSGVSLTPTPGRCIST